MLLGDRKKKKGGGKAKAMLQDPIISRVICLIRPQVEPLKNEYDKDHIKNKIESQKNEDIVEDLQDEEYAADVEKTTTKDWSHYNPSMLKAPCSSALRTQNYNFKANTEVITKEVLSEKLDISKPINPKIIHQSPRQTVGTVSSRRRPVLRRPQAEALVEAKLATLTSATQEATKEHTISLQILELQREQEIIKLEVEKKKLSQEKLKTELLKIEVEKTTGVTWEMVCVGKDDLSAL